jgi:FHA domain-containing protein
MGACLVIRALSLNDMPLSQPINGVFDENGGSIGRADTNTMTLPDPERLISRLHARVSWDRSEFWIQDVGHGIGSLLNGKPIGNASPVRLKPQDELRIGGYRLIVDDEDAAADLVRQRTITHRSIQRGESAGGEAAWVAGRAATPASPGGDPFADLLAPAPSPAQRQIADPFGDLIGGAPPASPAAAKPADPFDDLLAPQAGSVRPGGRSPPPAPGGPRPSALPEDFNPFATPPEEPVIPASPGDPFALIDDGGQPGALDKAFGLADSRGKDPLADFVVPAPPAAGGTPLDPLHFLRRTPAPAPSPVPPPAANHTPELQAAYVPPRIVEPAKPKRPAEEPKPPLAAPAPSEPTTPEMWQEFLEGAGLPRSFPQAPTPYLMRVIGTVVRELTEGVLQLLAARAVGKNQAHVEMTVIQARNNNPLKFSPNVRVALSQLLQPPESGFLPAPEAVKDAMGDLRTHQIGTMAGMRVAMESVLERFDPHVIERQLERPGALDALFPSKRKARLWELYVQHFRAARGHDGENFQQLFESTFRAAYEEQVERLERGQAGKKR